MHDGIVTIKFFFFEKPLREKFFAIPEKSRYMFRLRRQLVHPASGGNAVWQKICQIVTKYPEVNAASSEKNPGNDFELIILKENL